MFQLSRFLSITSLASIVITAALLVLFYQQLLIRQTLQISERSNLDLAHSLLTSIRPELDEYLASVEAIGPSEPAPQSLSMRVLELFSTVLRETSVVRIKLYNDRGVVVFSTDPAQIGDNQVGNAGMLSAGSGQATSGLAYRGTVNRNDREVQEDNLLETYVPVRTGPEGAIRGVLEIYTQANPLIYENDRAAVITLAGVVLILLCHYASLILAVRRAKNVIESQQQIIRERTTALERLSTEMLKSEEVEKQRLAIGLHEGLAQTLSAIKVCIEQALERSAAGEPSGGSLQPMVPALQDAIGQVRSIAMELRPSSLDDLGLVPTIDWFCRELESRHPEIVIDNGITLEEQDVPAPLKVVIYRIVETALREMAEQADVDRIRLGLRLDGPDIVLTIEEIPNAVSGAGEDAGDATRQVRFAAVQERTTLSGGSFAVSRTAAGGTLLRAAWEAAPNDN